MGTESNIVHVLKENAWLEKKKTFLALLIFLLLLVDMLLKT
jgi:hypothetical protein